MEAALCKAEHLSSVDGSAVPGQDVHQSEVARYGRANWTFLLQHKDRERSLLHPPPHHSWSPSKLAGIWAGLMPAWGRPAPEWSQTSLHPNWALREAFLKVCYNKVPPSSPKRSSTRAQLMVNHQQAELAEEILHKDFSARCTTAPCLLKNTWFG